MKPSSVTITKTLVLTVAALFALCSCTGTAIREGANSPLRESYYGSLIFDSHGMPEFSEKLPKRPEKRGDDFFLVEEDAGGKPLKYYHISVRGGKADMKKPFRTLLDRTASGIAGGASFAFEILMSNPAASTDEEAAAMLTFAALSVAVGTVGGITVGLVQGTYEAVQETGRSISSFEELLAFSHCDYDKRGRLSLLRAFEQGETGAPAMELFRVRYAYEGSSGVPVNITVEDVVR